MADTNRIQRLAGEIHQILASLLLQGLKDPRVGHVSITRIDLTSDLSVAKVFYSPLGGQGDPALVAAGLRAATGWLRTQLGKRLRIRHVPELRFILDQGIDEAMAVTRIIDELARASHEEHAEE